MILPTGLLLAQGVAAETDRIRALGVSNACFPLPTLYGPALGEWILRAGDGAFFGVVCIPATLGVLLMLRHTPSERTSPERAGYLALIRDRLIWLPNLAMSATGLGYVLPTLS